jgi:hypothetical protein
LILGQVDTRLLLEGVDNVFNQDDIKVLTTKMGISVYLENALLHLQDGNIECPTTKIVDRLRQQ